MSFRQDGSWFRSFACWAILAQASALAGLLLVRGRRRHLRPKGPLDAAARSSTRSQLAERCPSASPRSFVVSFTYRNGELCAHRVALADVADAVGTPAYVYAWPDMRERLLGVERALRGIDHRVCFAVKANGNLSVLARFAAAGAGFDIVSGGELERVLRAGGSPSNVVFSGVGKSVPDIDFAIKCGVDMLNVESESELERIAARAQLLGQRARIAVRVNPDVDPGTHPYIATGLKESKFGVPREQALALLRRAVQLPALEVVGVACHIGSQISQTAPFKEALAALLTLVDELAAEGIRIEQLDIGGGFGVRYQDEAPLDVESLGGVLRQALDGRDMKLIVEPGRFLVADAGVLLTRVEYLKPASAPDCRSYAIVDAAMNDLLRPALYQAWHEVQLVSESLQDAAAPRRWNIVGPVCESGDFLALDRELALSEGALLAIRSAGAYGFAQSSNYNSRPRPPEVIVDETSFAVARERETPHDMLRLESIV